MQQGIAENRKLCHLCVDTKRHERYILSVQKDTRKEERI